MIDYNNYKFTKEESIKTLGKGLLITVLLGSLFYKSIIAILVLLPLCFIYIKKETIRKREVRRWKLNLEFRDGIMSISAALNTGYSIENAVREAVKDLKLLYEEDALIIKEFEHIVSFIGMNKTVEEAFADLASRTELEDIYNFTEVFITAKRTGGDLMKIIRATAKTIGDKIEIKREIHTLITAKRFETRIMNIIPLGIILYMWIFSPGFLNPLYHNLSGIIVMSIALSGYLGAYIMSEHIMNMEV